MRKNRVVKHNGTREIFSREKLLAGLLRACEKTTVSSQEIEQIVSGVEKELISRGEAEVDSKDIGEIVIEMLADTNEVAYVRFASVYKGFSNLAGFEAELEHIRARKKES